MGRGKKSCPQCGVETGPRAYTCKNCGHEYTVKTKKRRKRKKWESVDWKELEKGDIIKVKTGTGPFYTTKDGEYCSMGVFGLFRVDRLIDDGIFAYPHKNKSHSGYSYIYMGKWHYSEETNIERRAHEILRFIPREKVDN